MGGRAARRLRCGAGPGAYRLLPAAVERRRYLLPLSSNRYPHRVERVLVQVTSVGHAGIRIDTKAGSILCDPWVNPAYFASWFPFPDNSALDWDALGDVDYLYVSHLHRDHFDPKNLREHVNKDAVVLLPDYPVPDLQRALEDGPIGDSGLVVDDGETVCFNMNDARPVDLDVLHADFGHVDVHMLQY